MTQKYMTGEQRRAQLQAELDQLEGKTMDPQDPVDTQIQDPAPAPVDWEKRYKDLQSHSTKQIQELRAQIPAQDFETENEALQRKVAELHADLEARKTSEAVRDAQAAVGAAHPDFVSVISSEAFATWIKAQPEVFQKAIYDDIPNAQIAIKAISLFKLETTPAQPAAQRPDPASMNMRNSRRGMPEGVKGPKIWSMAEIQRMTPQQYAQHEAEIDKAFAEGRIR